MRAVLALVAGGSEREDRFATCCEGRRRTLMASLLAEAARLAGSDGAVRRRAGGDPADSGWPMRGPRASCFPKLLDARAAGRPFNWRSCRPWRVLDRDVARADHRPLEVDEPRVRREAVEVLFSRRDGIEAVLGALRIRALVPSELDPARLKQLQAQLRPVAPGPGRKIWPRRRRPSRDRSQIVASTGRRSSSPGTASKGATSSPRRAPPATRPRAKESTSVPTWRRSRTGRPRTCSPTSSTRTARSRPIS